MNTKLKHCTRIYEFSFIDYQGIKNTYTGTGKNLTELGQFHKFEKRWSKEFRNNNPNSPRIPKIGDKVRLDVEFVYYPPHKIFNGAVGTIIDYKNGFFIFQHGKYKDCTINIKPYDIQWYY